MRNMQTRLCSTSIRSCFRNICWLLLPHNGGGLRLPPRGWGAGLRPPTHCCGIHYGGVGGRQGCPKHKQTHRKYGGDNIREPLSHTRGGQGIPAPPRVYRLYAQCNKMQLYVKNINHQQFIKRSNETNVRYFFWWLLFCGCLFIIG